MMETTDTRKAYKIDGMDREFATHDAAMEYLASMAGQAALRRVRRAHDAYTNCLRDYHRAVGMLEETELTDGEIKRRWETFLDIQGWNVRSRGSMYSVCLVKQIPMDTREGLRVLRVLVKYLLRNDLKNISDDLRRHKMRIKECNRELAKYLSAPCKR